MKSEEFLKKVKKGNIGKLIAGLIFILIAASTFATFYYFDQDDKKNPIDMFNVNASDIYAKIEVQYMLDYFAYSTDNPDLKSYIVSDKNNVLYIIDINKKDFSKFQEIWDYMYAEEEPEKIPDPVTVYGKTKLIDSELKKLAISYYNEVLEEEVLTNSNFETAFGRYYLDTYEEFTDTYLFSGIITGGIFGVIGLVFVITFVLQKNKTKKMLAKYNEDMDKILNAIDNESCYYNKKTKVYFTDTCIVSYVRGLEIIPYEDIVWIYPHEYRYRGSVTKSIYVITKDSKVHIISQLGITKKTSVIFDEEYTSLINRVPEVLLGYSKENALKAKELYIKK